ncbi:MAG: type II toxin-antitoxin system RelB/DinJ family antitoxin [Proteobacteria bacterium]|nr:type II toxin-antitoxin system RelB/DinJ family antitoxin [Pseudomonadota bacterium]
MSKTDIINARIEPRLKRSAETIFRSLGMTTTDAISMFLSQVVLNRGIPFPVKIPNKITRQAMKDLKTGKGVKKYKSSRDLMNDLSH